MDLSLSTPSPISVCQPDVYTHPAYPQTPSRPNNFLDLIRSNMQETNTIRIQNCRSEYRSANTERQYTLNEPENPERSSPKSDMYAVRLLEKVLKEKNIQADKEQTVKRRIQLKTTGILTERSINVGAENKEPKLVYDLPTNSGKQIKHHKSQSYRLRDENNPALAPKKEVQNDNATIRKLQKYSITQLLYISKSKFDFGTTMPGQILDEAFDIVNKTNQNIVVQIYLDCEHAEFRDMDEYVYSIRRSHLYDFNDKHFLIMSPYSSATFKVTLKVPAVKRECENKGHLDISIQGLKEVHRVLLESKIVVPKLTCPKTLHHRASGCSVINLAVKDGKKQDLKLPFKNEGSIPITVEFSFHDAKESKEDLIDCCIYPETVTFQPGAPSLVTLVAKSVHPDLRQRKEGRLHSKKVLLGKVRGSGLVYYFLLNIETY